MRRISVQVMDKSYLHHTSLQESAVILNTADPNEIHLADIKVDAVVEAYMTVALLTKDGMAEPGTVQCKMNTRASGNIRQLLVFQKLFLGRLDVKVT